jgi:hypothetical protein
MGERCDAEVFEKGESVAALDACMHVAEEWVQAVAKESGQRVDWHYSGGIANVLCLGDRRRAAAAVAKLRKTLEVSTPKTGDHRCRCSGDTHEPARILRTYGRGEPGPYRAGDPVPEGARAVDTTSGTNVFLGSGTGRRS